MGSKNNYDGADTVMESIESIIFWPKQADGPTIWPAFEINIDTWNKEQFSFQCGSPYPTYPKCIVLTVENVNIDTTSTANV